MSNQEPGFPPLINNPDSQHPDRPISWSHGYSNGVTIIRDFDDRIEKLSTADYCQSSRDQIISQLRESPTEILWVCETYKLTNLPDPYYLPEETPDSARTVSLAEAVGNAPEHIRKAVEHDLRVTLFDWAGMLQSQYDKVINTVGDDSEILALKARYASVDDMLTDYEIREARYKNLLLDGVQVFPDSFKASPPVPTVDLGAADELREAMQHPITVSADPWGDRDKTLFYLEIIKAFS